MLFERLLIYTFIITALYDVLLRFLSLNYNKLPAFMQEYKFIGYLTPYFKQHTMLAAALIAGFVGFGAQFVILNIQKFPNMNRINIKEILMFLLLTFVVSALYGFPMKASNMFPHLDRTYYKNLGTLGGMWADGCSGLWVQCTLLVLVYLRLLK